MSKKGVLHILVLLSAIFLSSCIKQQLETEYNNQEARIDAFITKELGSKPEATITRNGGSNRLTLVNGEGDELKAGGTITFYYAGYIFTGSKSNQNIFATNHEETAVGVGLELTDMEYTPLTLTQNDKSLLIGLQNGFLGIKKGEECYIVFSGKYGYGNKVNGSIPQNSALLYHIWVKDITNP